MDGGAWWAAVHGVTKSRTRLIDFPFTFHFHALEKEMATHSSILAWRIPGMGEPGGLLSMGSHRVGHDWSNLAAAPAATQYCKMIILPTPQKKGKERNNFSHRSAPGFYLCYASICNFNCISPCDSVPHPLKVLFKCHILIYNVYLPIYAFPI